MTPPASRRSTPPPFPADQSPRHDAALVVPPVPNASTDNQAATVAAGAAGGAEAFVAATAVQLPAFFPTAPKAWFAALECDFDLKGITHSITKYNHAVNKLDSETATQLQELLCQRATIHFYDNLRRHLCDLYETSPEVRMDEALSLTSMGGALVRTY